MNVDDQLAGAVIDLAKRAGLATRKFFRSTNLKRSVKEDGSDLTAADLASDRIIREGLAKITPDIPVLTEETVGTFMQSYTGMPETCWVVDPVDGTRNFRYGKPMYAVLIGLVHKGHPVFGISHAPILDYTYCARMGLGTWYEEGKNPAIRIETKKAKLPPDVLRSYYFPGIDDEKLEPILATIAGQMEKKSVIIQHEDHVRTHSLLTGKEDVEFIAIAEGWRLMGRCGGLWDLAAPDIILREAGGALVDFDGAKFEYLKPDYQLFQAVAVAQPSLLMPLVRELAPLRF
jgi:3'(2'), 5'-bisphosphate nucleotidase